VMNARNCVSVSAEISASRCAFATHLNQTI
jgi:hypothetical protein